MEKTLFRLLKGTMFVAMAGIWLFSCKPKISDQDIEAKIQSNTALSHLVATVQDGVVTLSGEAKDQADQMDSEAAVKSIEGVKQVINNTTIAPPPPPAPVEIAADDPLTKGIADALKDFPTVKATAADGIITVTGETTAANWRKIKMTLDGLKPKKVDATALKIN
ncbi:BON domain-containing protein [Agriterribacter sp.]|uniref:BON domain-containing protein n=1 Tax=Agriterribacter sp. TaxID=2821509 RepID=UPI002C4BEA73|nr:BON domain-containing protein [Agriterribacter sp.]HRO45061.1 BON domain-containing protein [Agriterribacter sp.]HRQ15498.1 BON domain-containing protein [Agriterribacter sp.]